MIDYDKLGEQINAIEFDHAFTLHPDGSITDADDYVPNVYDDPENDIYIEGNGWCALTGFTGQYSYNGAVLHSSEFIGSGMASRMHDMTDWEDVSIAHPVTFGMTTVIDSDEYGDYDGDFIGWVVLEKVA